MTLIYRGSIAGIQEVTITADDFNAGVDPERDPTNFNNDLYDSTMDFVHLSLNESRLFEGKSMYSGTRIACPECDSPVKVSHNPESMAFLFKHCTDEICTWNDVEERQGAFNLE